MEGVDPLGEDRPGVGGNAPLRTDGEGPSTSGAPPGPAPAGPSNQGEEEPAAAHDPSPPSDEPAGELVRPDGAGSPAPPVSPPPGGETSRDEAPASPVSLPPEEETPRDETPASPVVLTPHGRPVRSTAGQHSNRHHLPRSTLPATPAGTAGSQGGDGCHGVNPVISLVKVINQWERRTTPPYPAAARDGGGASDPKPGRGAEHGGVPARRLGETAAWVNSPEICSAKRLSWRHCESVRSA